MDEASEEDYGSCDNVVAATSGIGLSGLIKMTSNGGGGSREMFVDKVQCKVGPSGKVTNSNSFDPSTRDRGEASHMIKAN